jgi:hypothetical protein
MDRPDLHKLRKMERRFYLKAGLLFVLGVLLLSFVWTAPRATITGIVGILGLLCIIVALMLFSAWLEIFSKARHQLQADNDNVEYRETAIEWPQWFRKWGHIPLVVGLGLMLQFLGRKHENDFGGNTFVLHTVIAGIGTGVIIYQLLRLFDTKIANDKKLELCFFATAVFLVLLLSFGPILNARLGSSKANCRPFKVQEKSAPYLFIWNDEVQQKERFVAGHDFIKSLGSSPTVILCIRKGGLGYDYVERFQLP